MFEEREMLSSGLWLCVAGFAWWQRRSLRLAIPHYRVITASNGLEAVRAYENKQDEIELVILDMIMQEMGGGETFDRLRAVDPQVKVLLSSGYSINGDAKDIMGRGCNGFIQKPFVLGALSKKIREILD